MKRLISKNSSLLERFATLLPPEYLSQARAYKWASDALTDDDIVEFFPPWLLQVVKDEGEKGRIWLNSEIGFLRSIFGGEHD